MYSTFDSVWTKSKIYISLSSKAYIILKYKNYFQIKITLKTASELRNKTNICCILWKNTWQWMLLNHQKVMFWKYHSQLYLKSWDLNWSLKIYRNIIIFTRLQKNCSCILCYRSVIIGTSSVCRHNGFCTITLVRGEKIFNTRFLTQNKGCYWFGVL